MNKEKLNKVLNRIKFGCMILFTMGIFYIIFFSTDNVCVEVQQADEVDLGTHCFRTIGESNEFKLYLIDKYDLDKPQTSIVISDTSSPMWLNIT